MQRVSEFIKMNYTRQKRMQLPDCVFQKAKILRAKDQRNCELWSIFGAQSHTTAALSPSLKASSMISHSQTAAHFNPLKAKQEKTDHLSLPCGSY